MKKLLIPALLALALAACETDPQKDTAQDTGNTGTIQQQTGNTGTGTSVVGVGTRLPNWAVGQSVYFDYDSYTIRSDYRQLVNAHATYLANQPSGRVTIQGNADQRGSREYNLALGQKRAEAVRRAMRMEGANDAQIEAISFGKEHPRCTQATESCYAQNRRGDFVYR
jgi:peptidoglycan-associated lipoprotein